MIKGMFEYGYKYIGVIPYRNYEIAYKEYMDDCSVLILYPDGTEAFVEDSSDFFRLKDTVMYGYERVITETKLIKKAIEYLRYHKKESYYNVTCIEWIVKNTGKKDAWKEVLNILGFTEEEIELMIKEADLGFEE